MRTPGGAPVSLGIMRLLDAIARMVLVLLALEVFL
jgi:hypothetical protein